MVFSFSREALDTSIEIYECENGYFEVFVIIELNRLHILTLTKNNSRILSENIYLSVAKELCDTILFVKNKYNNVFNLVGQVEQ
jgi:hypothetical protein